MDELLQTVISNAPSVIVLLYLVVKQQAHIERLTESIIKRENCIDDDETST